MSDEPVRKAQVTGKAQVTLTIAVDFDGTCVQPDHPNIGGPVQGAIETLKWMEKRGHRLILHTMRSGISLDAAIRWFHLNGIILWAVNENPEQKRWTKSQKVYADLYIDDTAYGAPMTWRRSRFRVLDWSGVKETVLKFETMIAAQDGG